jgi:protein farnesyltransferase subunit beta
MLTSAYQWTSDPIVEAVQIFDEEDRVNTWHPVFVVPEGLPEKARAYFASKGGF